MHPHIPNYNFSGNNRAWAKLCQALQRAELTEDARL
jgi:crotonobetainyl-CoA:carnitine CoA-transferase CaiB-like acyl-CoA transferase